MDATVKRTALETFDVPGSKYETVMMLVELPPLTKTGFHTHPGFDSAYCLDGSLTVVALGMTTSTFVRLSRGRFRGSFTRSGWVIQALRCSLCTLSRRVSRYSRPTERFQTSPRPWGEVLSPRF